VHNCATVLAFVLGDPAASARRSAHINRAEKFNGNRCDRDSPILRRTGVARHALALHVEISKYPMEKGASPAPFLEDNNFGGRSRSVEVTRTVARAGQSAN